VGGTLYVAAGGRLLSVAADGTPTDIGEIRDDPDTVLSANRARVTVAARGDYFVLDGSTVTKVTDGALAEVGSVAFLDQYTVMGGRDLDQFEWTRVGAPATRDATYFATAESDNDNVVRVAANRGNLWVFGEQSIEIWDRSGTLDSAFTYIKTIETGLRSVSLLTRFDGGLFFVGDDNTPYIGQGADIRPVPSIPVNVAIENGDPTHCFYYEDQGHKFCVIRFSDRPAWVYDFATALWHERAYGALREPWNIIGAVKAFGRWFGLTQTAKVYEFDRNNVDVGAPLVRTVVSKNYKAPANREFVMDELVAFGKFGQSDLGRDAKVVARFSDDGGRSWGREKTRVVGGLGDREARALWRRQGHFRQMAVELTVSDPADITLESEAELMVS
jgi:hypothetical protein